MERKRKIPYIGDVNGGKALIVDQKPYTMLAGEVHNSSSCSLAYMEENVWPYIRNLELNTVFVPVMWNLIEPQPGGFDFGLAEGIICQARRENMRLVFLWFGLWKNGESDYVPDWIKRDGRTYFRTLDQWGAPLNCISPFCMAAVDADAAAFAAFMSFLKEFDQDKQTVLMIQVENEVGLLGADRDYGEAAQACLSGEIPGELKELAGGSKSWTEAFGAEAPEAMMAWAFAGAVEKIAASGARNYPLPMYTNAWLEQYPCRPGTFPSGGPIARLLPIWKRAAPSLFGVEPDIYLRDMEKEMKQYCREDNPLLIPEARRDVITASYAIHAVAGLHALGYTPFGIEDIGSAAMETEKREGGREMLRKETLESLQISQNAYDPSETAGFLREAYRLLKRLDPLCRLYRSSGHQRSFIRSVSGEQGILLSFEKFDFLITYEEDRAYLPLSCGGVFELDPNTFLLYGCRYKFELFPKRGERLRAGILSLEEGTWEKDGWQGTYFRNGDEKHCCFLGNAPGMICLKAYTY